MTASRHRVYIGLGANLGDRAGTLRAAMTELGRLGSVAAISSLYETRPWGDLDQPDYLNAAVRLETDLEPDELLGELKGIELRFGRVPARRWGPRALDLDILTYDDREIDRRDPRKLQVPHPHLRSRAFVLVPLAEIDEAFAAMRDRLDPDELSGVRPYER